jgi:hypothetical protein
LERVRKAFEGDERATAILEDFEEKPTTYATALADKLRSRLERDPQLATAFEELLDGAGSQVVIQQELKKLAGEVVGIDTDTLEELRALITQKAGTIEKEGRMVGLRNRKEGSTRD